MARMAAIQSPRGRNALHQRGQGLSEYIIIVALIAVAAIGVVGFFGDTLSNQMAGMAMEMAGQGGDTAQQTATAQAASAQATAATAKTLDNYASAN